ncbi:hypothetical protein Dsin_031927 [Dipteronia sinensis]|uniref:Uncharacterized protein n=1 Tax=Dipteronia sinensis TaxID=43782 RepID=A0AAD9ZLY3_9ROSI|nr:hypothetical protein Dsin_031927 [Dipteronia sinensis]
MGLSLWERYFLNGIEILTLDELQYWPTQDMYLRQRSLSFPGVALFKLCLALRKLFIHGIAHEHFMMFLPCIPNLRDVQFINDYHWAPDHNMSTHMRLDSCNIQSLKLVVPSAILCQHLLVAHSRLSHAAAAAAAPSDFQGSLYGTLDTECKAINEFYFKSLASVQLLQQICLKLYDDFTAEQINRSAAFLNHLIVIQQMQWDTSYNFAKHLKSLHESAFAYESLCSSCSNSEKIVEKTHSNSYQSVRATTQKVLAFIERFARAIQKSKGKLMAEQFNSAMQARNQSTNHCNGNYSEFEALFGVALSKTCENIMDMLRELGAGTSIMTHGLAKTFASLYSKGFGVPAKDQEDDSNGDKSQDASGTGIKMEQDFAADTFSVSEDSSGVDDDDDKYEKEKYESGPSVKDGDQSSRELRAMEDSAMADEPGELNFVENDGQKDENGDQDDLSDTENAEDLNMDKDEAFVDPSGLKLYEPNQNVDEDIGMDEKDVTEEEESLEEHENDGTYNKEEVGPEEDDECAENGNSEDVNTNPVDETMEEPENGQAGADNTVAQDGIEDENADEYEKGTAQALGPAADHRDDATEMEIDKKASELHPIEHHASILKSKMEQQMQISDQNKPPIDESPEVHRDDDDDGAQGSLSESLSLKKKYLNEDIYQLSKLFSRKLQGDYKTGKRINMKKVIPLVASHYRKDKIWLSKKGNIGSLHDFDQPFTGMAGIKMISGLTFKQENTIADEPVVDLLNFCSNI